MTLEQLLIQLGLNISSSFVYDVVKGYFAKEQQPTVDGLQKTLAAQLNIEGADIRANNIIQFLAQNGDINISGSQVYAAQSIIMVSKRNTQFTFGNNSSSRTDKSAIDTGRGAQITGQGGAKIEQDEEGNIKFFT